MVPFQGFLFEKQHGESRKYEEGNYLLQYFELHQGERPAIAHIPNPVSRDLETREE